MKAHDTKSIYLFVQPNGDLWLEDIKSVFTDKQKAFDFCELMNKQDERGWTVMEFASMPQDPSPLLSGWSGGLRERTLRQIAKDYKAAMEL